MLTAGAVLLVACALLAYVYVAYPVLLLAISRLRGPRPVLRQPQTPRVSLVISAFNEAHVIGEKIRNALALDYPADRLEIVVISDASDDGTDAVVRSFAPQGVRLLRQDARQGKTAGLNRFVPELTGEIVVFSDANAMYDPASIRMLVRNFADPDVGCVTGESRYVTTDRSSASLAERAYWQYEIWIKRLETAVGSMVGADGAIYAIRRQLWWPLPDNAINDFLNPLLIVGAGWRSVYEPEAICAEAPAGDARREYRRRVRIVSRSWRAVFQAHGVLNPFRVGLFALSLLSHKVLRWMTGLFVTMALVSAGVLAAALIPAFGAVAAVAAGVVVVLMAVSPPARRAAGYSAYYLLVSWASVVGLVKGTFGRVSGVWTTPRTEPAVQARVWHPGGMTLAVAAAASVAGGLALILAPSRSVHATVFWSAVGLLAYVYLGYPALLALARRWRRRPVHKAAIEPGVTLLIAANNEAAVIEAKLRNSLALDYPAARLTIVVASDGSVDGTNELVRAFAPEGVRLVALPERLGKISAINAGLREIDSEIVVLSDANAFLRPDAVRALVRNFADPRVGAVSGDVILVGDRAALARSEDLYYRYERWLQQAESEVGSMLGVDGALYAVRRSLFVPPPADTILDDMAIPMAVSRAGYRVVFEPDAIAHEHGSDTASEEFARKVRVVAGAMQFLLRRESAVRADNLQLLLALVSHKTLRWFSPLFATLAFGAALVMSGHSPLFLWAALLQGGSIVAALLGCVPAFRRASVLGLAHYFWLVQAAAIIGFVRGLLGRQSVAWRRFAREPISSTPAGRI